MGSPLTLCMPSPLCLEHGKVAKEFVGQKTLFISDVRTAQWRHMESEVSSCGLHDLSVFWEESLPNPSCESLALRSLRRLERDPCLPFFTPPT